MTTCKHAPQVDMTHYGDMRWKAVWVKVPLPHILKENKSSKFIKCTSGCIIYSFIVCPYNTASAPRESMALRVMA